LLLEEELLTPVRSVKKEVKVERRGGKEEEEKEEGRAVSRGAWGKAGKEGGERRRLGPKRGEGT